MLGHRDMSIDDYIAILRRRWWVILVPAVLGPIIAFGISLKLPSRYTSQTLVLVEGQRVPDNYVKSVITADLNARIGTMREQILSRTRLQPIIERFGLFKEDLGRKPMEVLVERMRKDIAVAPVRSVLTSTEEGATNRLPGFFISFSTDNPRVAQQVCQEITSMFIEEDLRQRERTATDTTSFLQTQLDDAKRKLDEQDSKLAQFKRAYIGELPEETQTNLNLLGTLNTQLQSVTQALNAVQRDKVYTESLLAQQVSSWETVRAGSNPHPETMDDQLAAAENQLVQLQTRYTNDHPDVIKAKAVIEELKRKKHEVEAAARKPVEKAEKSSGPEPAQIQQLRSQLRSYEQAIQEYTREQAQLQHQIKAFQGRLQLSPGVEQQYKLLTRDYQTALDFYNDLLRKKSQSAMATDLERRQQGEQFRVMDPANLPEMPSFPDRPMFAAVGLGGGLGLGLVLALLLELRDKSIRTEGDVEFFLGLPTLVMIPTIENGHRKRKGVPTSLKKQKAPVQTVGV